MTHIEMMLRLSLVQVELVKLAEALDPTNAKVVRYSVKVLGLLRNPGVTAGVTANDNVL